ncbi:MAG: SGNH/GDSL hydrolase family protein, partial [Candidatus Omnitrophica bacterium]|nr:SGNH/GDSL hydrolase family protein [Candidatus Omnitrophota bacterium]
FQFKDGDRIVLLGNTLFEREGNYGYIETLFTRHFPSKSLTFRNLGYSAETVEGESRAMFDTPKVGFQRMIGQVVEASPTVIFISFGQNAAYQGEEELQRFMDGYRNLVNILEASTEARFVVLSPPALEKLEPPLPEPAEQNARVEKYVEAIRKFSEEKGFFFVDLFHPLLKAYEEDSSRHWTNNTIHFNPYGYWRLGLVLLDAFGLEEKDWKAIVDLGKLQIDGAEVRFDS